MKTTYRFYSDPGHGWLAVPTKDIVKVGVQDLITSCSYIRGDTAYLEEDLDAGTFVKAREAHGDIRIDYRPQSNNRSRIRNYATYAPPPDPATQLGIAMRSRPVEVRPDGFGEEGAKHYEHTLERRGQTMTVYTSQAANLYRSLDIDEVIAMSRRTARLCFLSIAQIKARANCDDDKAQRILNLARQTSNDLARLFPEEVIHACLHP